MQKAVFIVISVVLIVFLMSSILFGSGSDLTLWKKERAILHDFIVCHVRGYEKERLTDTMGDGGNVYSLSESVGLSMSYYAAKGVSDFFSKEYRFLTKKLMADGRYIKWKTGEKVYCNAAIDDFRIIRALLDGYERFGKKKYFNTAGFIQEGIYSRQVVGGNLYEFYDWNSDAAKAVIPLCYIDLYTMDRLRVFSDNWLNVADRGLSIIKNGRMGEECPFFYKYYDYKTGRYMPDEELKEEGGICLTYTLYTVIHLAEVNEDTRFFTNWLKNELKGGRLYGWYNPETLKPSRELESTAVYALAAVYSKKAGQDNLYHKLVERMLDFMVTDEDSPYYGGFGNEDTGEFYSFDNLTALWALGMADS